MPAAEAHDAEVHRWDWSALAYHRRSRATRFRKAPAHAAVTERPLSSSAIPLARTFPERRNSLPGLLSARRSYREWPHEPIAFGTLSELLWLSARDRISGDENGQQVSRPYPSGGGAYSLQIYPVIGETAVDGLPVGVYRYSPRHHALEAVSDQCNGLRAVPRRRGGELRQCVASSGSIDDEPLRAAERKLWNPRLRPRPQGSRMPFPDAVSRRRIPRAWRLRTRWRHARCTIGARRRLPRTIGTDRR